MSDETDAARYARAAIYIPAFNAARTLPRVLERIPAEIREGAAEILVVDNHSDDDTPAVVDACRTRLGLRNLELIRTPANLGYGGSQKVAYRHCIDRGHAVVAMLHGDAQYAPEVLPSLLAPVLADAADLVFGSRMRGDPLGGGMPLHRWAGNRFLTTVQNAALRTHLSEFHSGYRVFSVPKLAALPFERLASDYHFDTEMIILHVDRGLRVHEIPIPTFYGDEKNYVRIWQYGAAVLRSTISYALHARGVRRSVPWTRILGR